MSKRNKIIVEPERESGMVLSLQKKNNAIKNLTMFLYAVQVLGNLMYRYVQKMTP